MYAFHDYGLSWLGHCGGDFTGVRVWNDEVDGRYNAMQITGCERCLISMCFVSEFDLGACGTVHD